MPSTSIVRTSRLPRVPWKNGAGTTREAVVYPASEGSSGFRWRISVADIDQDSAFSIFAGADRHFLIASPGYLHLNIDGELRTAAYGRPETFPGEAEVSAKLATGPTSVINLITQRALCTGDLAVERADGPLAPYRHAVALALLDGAALTGDGQRLEPLDFLMCGPGTAGIQFKDALVATISVFPTRVLGKNST
jgi:environmental stress-induced protein Ves